jgi:ubiquitin-conjugating enzyme E2 A
MKTAVSRLQRDLVEVQRDDSVVAGPKGDDLFDWEAFVEGPSATAWEGALLRLELKFPQDYPHSPPAVRFMSRVYHPNVYGDGRLCLDLLKTQWSPSTDVRGLLVSIQSLLVDPNPNSPANPEAAELFVKDRMAYDARVRALAAASLSEAEAGSAAAGAGAAAEDDE